MNEPLYVYSYINEDWSCGEKKFQDPTWLKYRMMIYFRYTVPSLWLQSDPNFRIWLNCRPGSEKEIEPYVPALESANIIVTFDRLKEHLVSTVGVGNYFKLLRIDSDDIYGPNVVHLMNTKQREAQAAQFLDGFHWMAEISHLCRFKRQSTPFYCLRMAVTEDGFRKLDPKGMDSVQKDLSPLIMEAGQFCVIRHGKHSSTHPMCAIGRDVRRLPAARWCVELLEMDMLDFWTKLKKPAIVNLIEAFNMSAENSTMSSRTTGLWKIRLWVWRERLVRWLRRLIFKKI